MKKILLTSMCAFLIGSFAFAQKSQIDLPITWDDTANVDYTVSDFGMGVNPVSTIAVDPSNSSNLVLKSVKTSGAITWAGTTLSKANGIAKPIAFTAKDTIMKALVYSPDSGLTIRLKAEDAGDNKVFVQADAVTRTANGWDTLTFHMPNVDPTKTYNKVSIFFNYNVTGAGRTFYLDNVWFTGKGTPPPTKKQIDLPITWDDTANVDYTVTDFGGNSSMMAADLVNASNLVLKSEKTAGAQTWAGTTLSKANGIAKPIPFTAKDTIMKALVYSPDSGLTIRLKAEDAGDNKVFVEADAVTRTANGWDTLTFHMPNVDPQKIYNKVSIFFNFNVTGAGRTFYLDNVWFVSPPPPPGKAQIDLPITWDDTANVDYKVSDFGGNASMMAADPMNASNLVLKSDKQASAQTWGGTTLSTPMGLKSAIPFTPNALTISAIVYSPDTGIVVKLKAEDKDTTSISVETDVRTKVANGWDTLVFNFAVPSLGTAAYDSTKVYDKLSIFYNFGVDGATAGAKTYYVDDVFFGGKAGGPPPPPDSSKVTFRVDMRGYPKDSVAYSTPEVNGTFNNWCGRCNAMTDADGDSIWEVTITTAFKTIEYKFSVDNWKGQENLDTSLTCTKTSGQFTNRIMNLNGDVVLPAVCWNSCLACPALSVNELSNTQTIKVYPNPASSTVNISGFDHVKSIRVTDVVGNVLMSVSNVYNTVEMPLENYNSGIYFIQVVEDNNNVQSLRFIKN